MWRLGASRFNLQAPNLHMSCNYFNSLWPSDAICHLRTLPSLVQVMALCPTGNKPSPESIITWHLVGNKLHWNLNQNIKLFIPQNAFAIAVYIISAILFRPHCVKRYAWIHTIDSENYLIEWPNFCSGLNELLNVMAWLKHCSFQQKWWFISIVSGEEHVHA